MQSRSRSIFNILTALALLASLVGSALLAAPAHALSFPTFVVNTTSNVASDGFCSIEEAVFTSNNGGSLADCPSAGTASITTINFAIASGAQTITLGGPLGLIAPVFIDGTTQPGFIAGSPGVPLIRLDGATSVSTGLIFDVGSAGSTLKGVMVTNYTSTQVLIQYGSGTDHISLAGNYIGTDGTNLLSGFYGLQIVGSSNNQIGGAAGADRNLIEGDQESVRVAGSAANVGSDNNVIEGNYVGLNAAGTGAVGSQSEGIELTQDGTVGASNNLITGNVISGYGIDGIFFDGSSDSNTVQSNLIGTNASGTAAVANGTGVFLNGGSGNVIGGNGDSSKRNLISANASVGVYAVGSSSGTVIADNVFGRSADGGAALGNDQAIGIVNVTVAAVSRNWIANSTDIGFSISGAAPSVTAAADNCLTGNAAGVINSSGVLQTFQNNWWGAPDGPSGVASGSGDTVSADVNFTPWLTKAPRTCPQAIADFDGDGTTDVSVYRPSAGTWYVKDQFFVNYGLPGDIPVPADYNGDGRTDVAVFRPSTGTWYVKDQFFVNYGLPGDVPIPGDYNGDGRTDLAVYRPSAGTWYVKDQFFVNYGLPGDIPVPGDYNGDGRTDLAVYRPSTGTWDVKDQFLVNYGLTGDIPLRGDFDGNGSTDVAVYRPSAGTWYVKDQFFVNYGLTGDTPVPGDYNGDGRTDVAVFRPSGGTWYIKDQYFVNYGLPGDYPLPAPDTNGDGDPYQ